MNQMVSYEKGNLGAWKGKHIPTMSIWAFKLNSAPAAAENLKRNTQVWSASLKLSRVSYIIRSLKEVMSPYMIDIYYTNFLAILRYGIIICGGDNESNNIFKLQKWAIQIISGVCKHMSCRQLFKDYNILMVTSLYILEVVCLIKKYEDSLEHTIQLHNYNMTKKMELHI